MITSIANRYKDPAEACVAGAWHAHRVADLIVESCAPTDAKRLRSIMRMARHERVSAVETILYLWATLCPDTELPQKSFTGDWPYYTHGELHAIRKAHSLADKFAVISLVKHSGVFSDTGDFSFYLKEAIRRNELLGAILDTLEDVWTRKGRLAEEAQS